jgi:hypothetical protein
MANVAVGTSATQILAANTNVAQRSAVVIQNLGPNAITIGVDNTVTTANGITVATNGVITLTAGINGTLFAVAATAAQVSPADTRILVETAGT